MTPEELPDQHTHVTVVEMRDALAKAWPELSPASLLLLVTHWHLETAAGAGMHCFNVGNAKSHEGDGRSWTFFRCSEIIDGREVFFDPPHPQARFRAFEDLDAGAVDYVEMMRSTFSRSIPALLGGDPILYAIDLHIQRYYTADFGGYTAAICARLAIVIRELGGDVDMVSDAIAIALPRLGVFGGVKEFQRTRRLTVDGIVGPQTLRAIAHEIEPLERARLKAS